MAVEVGGTNGLIDRLLSLVDWTFSSDPAQQQRIDALNALNFCEQLIAQSESMMYLETETNLSLLTGNNYVAIPSNPLIDFGKEIVIGRPSLDGVIEYRPPDKFAAERSASAYAIGTEPSIYTIMRDHTSGERRFRFKPANTSGSTMTLPLIVQRIPPAFTDAAGQVSSLPEGYELTLLLPMAEEYIKSKRHEFGLDKLSASLSAQLQEFYNKQRSNKEKAQTDRGRERRKADVTVADEGY